MQRQADTIPAFKTLATFSNSIKSISKGEEGAHSIRWDVCTTHAHGHDLPWLAAGWPCPASDGVAHKDWRDLGSLWIDKGWDLKRGLENLWYLNRWKMYEHEWESSLCIRGHGENVLDESFHGAVVRLQDSCNQPYRHGGQANRSVCISSFASYKLTQCLWTSVPSPAMGTIYKFVCETLLTLYCDTWVML